MPVPEGPVTDAALAAFHAAHRDEYGHAFDDPVEIVNLRVTVRGRRPKLERIAVEPGTGARADGPVPVATWRVDGQLVELPDAARRPRGARRRRAASPARPSCCSSTPPSPSHRDGRPRRRRRASCSSPTPEGPAHERHDGRRPDHDRRHRRRAQSIAVEMGYRLTRMSYSSIIRESEDFGCAICDHERRQLCESTQSTPLQSGPMPGYLGGIDRRFAEVGDEWRPGDVVIHNHPYYGASHQPDVAIVIPIFLDDELVGFSATTAHHLDLGALTPGHLRDRRRDRRIRRGPPAQRDQGRRGGAARPLGLADPARQHARARARRRRHRGAGGGRAARRRAHARARAPLRARDGPRRLRAAHGPVRAGAAPRDRGAPGRHVPREGSLDGFLDHPDPPTTTCPSTSP